MVDLGTTCLFVRSNSLVCEYEFIRALLFGSDRTFTGDDGRKYVWKARKYTLSVSLLSSRFRTSSWLIHLQLYAESPEGGEGIEIAKLHPGRLLIKPKKGFIELFPGYEKTIDRLVGELRSSEDLPQTYDSIKSF